MSMLAEKKRREKWSLNPRGKAWSEDQNKFGQRLMEKMGWKAGQGLGANSQGQTDIVKTRVKNDIKGLGFKENGEEWLKTTSDFDNLLEELASSQDDSGEGSQSETPVSLEDRSKKSRARVHYHKFTRGKDLSRYSEKDLASIIGPDVIKLKNGQESKSDYTQNQVNKGSIEEYFKNKSKTKDVTADNIENGKTSSNLIEDLEISDSKMEGLDNTNEKLEADPESVNSVSPKKNKKKKRTVEDSESQVNSQDSGSYEVDENFLSPETEVPKIKKKKSKSSGMENNLQHEADDSVSLNFASSENSKTNRPKKDKGFSENIENSVHIDNLVSETLNNPDEKKPKKKKRKINDEEIEQSQDIDINTSKNSFVVDTGANEEIVPKKKKKRSKDESKEEHQVELQSDCNLTCTDPVASEETLVSGDLASKKKKKSNKNKEHHVSLEEQIENSFNNSENNLLASGDTVVSEEIPTKKKKKDKNKDKQDDLSNCYVMHTDENPVISEDTVTSSEPVEKKKKKKSKEKNSLLENESLVEEQLEIKKKCKKDAGENTGANETTPQCEQAISSNPTGDFLEVLGRKTRLKAIKNIDKTRSNESYNTEDFMSFCKADDSQKGSKDENSEEVNKECVYIYRKSNPIDVSIPKDVLSYENKLVIDKLSKHEVVKKPCIVVTDSQNLTKSAVKRLEVVHRTRYYKEFLSEQDKSEINLAVNKFKSTCPNFKESASKDVNQNCVTTKAKPVQETVASPNNKKVITGNDVENSKTLAITKKVEKSVNDEKDNYIKCYAETNTDDCKLPKHVVAYEYRLVCARLKRLDITPPEVKVVIKEANSLHETLKRKLKQIGKIRHLKALLPPHDLAEVEASVTKFHDSLKPKIEIMTAISEVEENMLKIADELDRKSELQPKKEEEVKLKSFLSEKAEEMIALFQKLETLLESYRKREEPIISESTNKDNDDDDEKDAEDQMESKLSWMKKVESKLDTLKQHMKMLKEGKKPPGLDIIKCSQNATKNAKGKKQFISRLKKNNHYQNTDYSRGRIAHNVADQRGRGRGIGHNQSAAKSWPVQRGGTESFDHINAGRFMERGRVGGFFGRGRGFSDGGFSGRGRGFGDGGFSGQGRGFGDGGFSGRGRGFGDGGFSGRGRGFGDGAFSGRGRDFGGGGFSGQGRGFGDEGFSGRGRGFGDGGFSGRGRGFSGGGFMGRGRGGINRERGRGRITQNNFEAKLYAERCKELNKLPEVLFNGVNMKAISGYAANIDVNKNKSSTSEDSKALPV